MSTQRLQSHVLRLDALGWVILQEATVLTGQLAYSMQLCRTSGMDFRGHFYHVLKIKFAINMGLFQERLQPEEHTVVEGRLLEQAYGIVPSEMVDCVL